MCGIAGYMGVDAGVKVRDMLTVQGHRGPDATGIYLPGKVIIKHRGGTKTLRAPETSREIALGHNLLGIVGGPQPLINRGVLVCNGEIYNYEKLSETPGVPDSDSRVILELIERHRKDGIEEALKRTVNELDGDYSFAYFDGDNLALVRDPLGVKPLFYSDQAFASERKALWRIGVREVKSLPPGSALLNGEVIRLRDIPEPVAHHGKYRDLKEELKSALKLAVEKRVRGLDKAALVFSGGVDSTLLALLLRDRVDIQLYTVGVEGSHDVKFAVKSAGDLEMDLEVIEVDREIIEEFLPHVIAAVEEYNVMKIGVAMPLYIASRAAAEDGFRVMFSGQGADELFAGYHRYKSLLKNGSLENALIDDIRNIYHVNLERDDAATMANSVELRVPFLDIDVIRVAFNIPLKYKIKDADDPLRKHVLREIALELGVPDYIALRPKKAAQYGSGIDKILRKKILPSFDHEAFMKDLMEGKWGS